MKSVKSPCHKVLRLFLYLQAQACSPRRLKTE
jgi:hypothetical protein